MLAGIYLAFVILRYLCIGGGEPGWTSVIASVWLFGGLSLLTMSLIGIYVAHIFSETKRRPYAIIRHLYRIDAPVRSTSGEIP